MGPAGREALGHLRREPPRPPRCRPAQSGDGAAATILDAGLRYRFHIGETPALLRFQVTNLTNEFDWKVVSSGAFESNTRRTATLFLTVDF